MSSPMLNNSLRLLAIDAVCIADKYLSGELSAEDAYGAMERVYSGISELSQADEDAGDLVIEHCVFSLKLELCLSGPDLSDYSEDSNLIAEYRNRLAKYIKYEQR